MELPARKGPPSFDHQTRRIGVSRPALVVEDLPTPEEVFGVRWIGPLELMFMVLGPSLIALGISIGSGEWLLGPLAVGQYGFLGIGWVILVSVVLQTFYNVELARFTIATGEPPVVAFGRTPPGGFLWIPLALFCTFIAFILGGWAVSAGSSLFALFAGRAHGLHELEQVRILGILLLLTTFLFVAFGRKIERSLELSQGIFVAFFLVSLVLVTLAVVPAAYWRRALFSLVTPAVPPPGSDLSLLGALAGFSALASGLNFMVIGYYRDKGYGMGHKTGYLSGLFGGCSATLLPVGRIFPEDEKNARCWRRWFRFLLIDQWGIYFSGCLVGMLAPCILVSYLAGLPGAELPGKGTILVYAGLQLGQKYGPVLFGWALLMGFFILYSTQIIILEMLTRMLTDALYGAVPRFRAWIGPDVRRFYFPCMLGLIVVISIMIHLAAPVQLLVVSANLSNLAAMVFPLATIYLNRQLPRPARITWWSHLALAANVVFFGFFFVNFVVTKVTGVALVQF